jgi:hypothetical protein
VSALPADQEQENPLDPERILRVLPDREGETFLPQYRLAVDGAAIPLAGSICGGSCGPGGLSARTGRALRGRGPSARMMPSMVWRGLWRTMAHICEDPYDGLFSDGTTGTGRTSVGHWSPPPARGSRSARTGSSYALSRRSP